MIKSLTKWGGIITLLLLFTACTYENVKLNGTENFKLNKIDGRTISFNFDAILDNPNNYKIKIKPSDLDLFINGEQVGIIKLTEQVKFAKKSESTVSVPVKAELMDGALSKLVTGALKKTVTVRVVGKVKGGVGIVGKSKQIDETREISLKDLNLNQLGLPF